MVSLSKSIRSFLSSLRQRLIGRREIELLPPPEIPEKEIEPVFLIEKEEGVFEEIEPVIEIPEEIPEEEKELPIEVFSKVVTFEERIRGTRIKRTITRTYPLDTNDGDINRILEGQYDSGGNFVINITSIEVKATPEYEEEEIERGMPGSADVSP